MSDFLLIMFLVGGAGFLISLVLLIVNAVMKKDTKKAVKMVAGFFVLAMLGIMLNPGSTDADKKTATTSKTTTTKTEQEKEKAPEELAAEKKAQEDAAKKIEEEKKAAAAAETNKWNEFVSKNTKQLSAGEHMVGTHLAPGAYDITFNGSGNFVVTGSDGSLLSNEIGGSDMGISKYRAILPEGAKIKISGMSINTKPIRRNLMSYSNISLHTGYWIVGQDVTEGRYKAVPAGGNGNFIIYESSGMPKINEILGGDMGVKEVTVNLDDGDIINIAGLNNVKLSPTN